MHDGLTALSTGIGYQTETILQAKLLNQSRDNLAKNVTGQLFLGLQTEHICHVLLGNDEDMNRCLRLQIVENCHLIILVYQCGGNLLSSNFAENAIISHYFPPFAFTLYSSITIYSIN